jgi:uncharacterized RDD family membrane protein YckC
VSTTNPYATSEAGAYGSSAEGVELAGRGSRLLAWFLDGVIASLMIYVPGLIVAAATGRLRYLEGSQSEFEFSVFAVPLFVCFMGFVAWAWITTLLVARYGQTLAKRLLEIRVVRSDGSQASLGRIFWLRNVVNGLLSIIPLYGLIDLLLIFGERRQCIHDLIADTIVVKA